MSFECSRCGACCRDVSSLPDPGAYDRGDGVCRHLTPENLCEIYASRPQVCRVDATRPAVFTEGGWNALTHEACARLHLHVYGQPIARP
jgi:Fe-S-cluster containining protein